MAGKGTVCVTGGTGYLASRLIGQLLDAGYTVHTTMRGTNRDVGYLTKLPGASERLKLFSADLDKPESFEPAISGCDGVFHVAHPMEILNGKEPEEVVTRRAINATLGILEAAVKSKTVKRVIHTSSTVAVSFNGKNEESPDEDSWSDVDFVRTYLMNFGGTYILSKTLTEKAVIDFAEKSGLDVVTINPSFITGPFSTPNYPESIRMTMPMVFGDQTVFDSFPTVHVDDVAAAQIHLYEYPNAKGRYICSSFEVTIDKLHEFLSKYPELKVPHIDYSEKVAAGIKKTNYSKKKLLDTGFNYKYGFEDTFDGAIQSCKERGVF